MADSFWGFGSGYRGDWLIPLEGHIHRIQTEWIILFFIPFIPLKSISVLSEGEEETYGIPPLYWGTRRFMTAINLKLFLPQVLWIYSWWSLCLALLVQNILLLLVLAIPPLTTLISLNRYFDLTRKLLPSIRDALLIQPYIGPILSKDLHREIRNALVSRHGEMLAKEYQKYVMTPLIATLLILGTSAIAIIRMIFVH
ncbi:MAG TPA: hypothetical protein VF398_09940 [bacterium]|jgi:hypothetical protein